MIQTLDILPIDAFNWWIKKADKLTVNQKRILFMSQCYYDIEFFAKNITIRWTTDKKSGTSYSIPDFHKKLWKLIKENKDVLCIVPRGFGKTTAVSKILVLWLLLFQIEQSIVLVMPKGLGESVVGDIRRELETNAMISSIWGDLVPISNNSDAVNEKWRQRHLQLLNKTEVETVSKGEAFRGRRPTKIIIDDPQENKDVKNPKIADEFFNWIFTSVYPALNPDGGSMAVLGTIISNNCFVNKLKEQAKEKSFEVVEFPAIIGNESLWPDRWPIEKLKEKQAKVGTRQFNQEFMNIPLVLNGSPVFDDDDKKNLRVISPIKINGSWHWFKEKHNKSKSVFIGIDLALGGIGGDYTVATIRDLNYSLIAQFRCYITQDRMCIELNNVVPYFKDVFIVPESNNALAFLLECKKYHWYNRLYKQKTLDKITMKDKNEYGWNTNTRTKPILINDLQQVIRNGVFEVSKEEFEELQYYYYDENGGMNAIDPYHDDTIISDALCIQGIKRGIVKPDILL